MISNIDKVKSKFIKIPKKYVENPTNSKDYLNDLYYKLSSVFIMFSKNELMDLLTPEHFFYDSELNLYISIDIDGQAILGDYNDYRNIEWGCTIDDDSYYHPTITYCFNTNKVFLSINSSQRHYKSIAVKEFDYSLDFYKENLILDEYYDWRTFKKTANEAISKTIDELTTHKFFAIDPWCEHSCLPEKRKKHDKHSMSSIDILESFKVVAGICIEVNYKKLRTTRNELDYKSGYWKRCYDFDDKIWFHDLLEDPFYFQALDEKFVKECVAYWKRHDIQNEIDELDHCLMKQISAYENEIKKLYRQIDKNKPKIEELKKKKANTKANDVKLNLAIPKKEE